MDDNKNGRQMRFADDELAIIKAAFKGNDKLLKLLRKVFLPEYDPTAPVGQVIDLWMTLDVRNQPLETLMTNILARNQLITHVEQQLLQLQVLAQMEQRSDEQAAEARKKDSVE